MKVLAQPVCDPRGVVERQVVAGLGVLAQRARTACGC
jgi:hypothetical protein